MASCLVVIYSVSNGPLYLIKPDHLQLPTTTYLPTYLPTFLYLRAVNELKIFSDFAHLQVERNQYDQIWRNFAILAKL